jgi:hypothetical protein
MQIITRTLLALMLASATFAIGQPGPTPATQPQASTETKPKPPETKTISAYKLEYNIYETEGGKRVNTRSYTLVLTDNDRRGMIRTGSRVPLTMNFVPAADSRSGTVQYQDVGLTIEAKLDHLILTTNIDMSSIAPEQSGQGTNPIIRSSKADAIATVILKKPMLLASIDDSLSKRSYQVEVTVTPE